MPPTPRNQSIHIVPSFTLESGVVLKNAEVAYKTWGELNAAKDNIMVFCHEENVSNNLEELGPVIGHRKLFDTSRFFIFSTNVLGSPYGSASPLTINLATGKPYGPSFPRTTICDDVRIHKLVLDHLKINSVAIVIGSSLGGMLALEWPLCTSPGYVGCIAPLCTFASHTSRGLAWDELQRKCIQSDPNFNDGYYTDDARPTVGLAAARMCALVSYNSSESFEWRFAGNLQPTAGRKGQLSLGMATSPPSSPNLNLSPENTSALSMTPNDQPSPADIPACDLTPKPIGTAAPKRVESESELFLSVQTYLRRQARKFSTHFDANCFIHNIDKVATHDILRDRPASTVESVLGSLPPALLASISSDELFPPRCGAFLAKHIPEAEYVLIESPEAHSGLPFEFAKLRIVIEEFLRKRVPHVYEMDKEVTSKL